MPLLKIQTNVEVPAASRGALLKQASDAVAGALGKPEQYVMVSLEHNPDMLFGGDGRSLAYLELKSIGLPEERTAELSASLCRMMSDHLGVAEDRTYIEFANAARHMWGWNGGTFER
ncbi:MAG: phenylpyruvate tautomerase MIF-related protein [Chromatiales bacterium]|jgi:phenylpyruvate tautomerase PptA (4-oxalocrotonate tautomerase family)